MVANMVAHMASYASECSQTEDLNSYVISHSVLLVAFHLCILKLIHQIIFRFYLHKYSLFFSSTLVLTSSIDVVFILSIGICCVLLLDYKKTDRPFFMFVWHKIPGHTQCIVHHRNNPQNIVGILLKFDSPESLCFGSSCLDKYENKNTYNS